MPFGIGSLDFIDNAIDSVGNLIDDAFSNKEERKKAQAKLDAVKNDLKIKTQKHVENLREQRKEIIKAEIQGESWMQRNWRPSLMYLIMLILFNNFIVAPYLAAYTNHPEVMLEMPTYFWQVLTVSLGGYIGGRTFEKYKKVASARERNNTKP